MQLQTVPDTAEQKLRPAPPGIDPAETTIPTRPRGTLGMNRPIDDLTDFIAGRAVIVALYSMGDSRESNEATWRQYQTEVKFSDLGAAAKKLKAAGIDWREIGDHTDILEAAEDLD